MSLAPPPIDLVAQARRRARLAALLGRLLLSEPGPDLAGLVEGIAELELLAQGGPDLAADYERALLRQVPPYQSVFCGPDGQRGGDLVNDVAELYRRQGFDEADRWRVAGPDHLGLLLRAYAQLCAEEASGWEADQPDRAARAVESARELLGVHVSGWAEVAMAAIAQRATGPYRALAEAVSGFVGAEAERLRPDPDHPDLPALEVPAPPIGLGPARLARWLLAPAACGVWLDTDDLAEAAHALGIPWRPSDPRSRLRRVVEAVTDAEELPALAVLLRPAVERWRQFHLDHEARCAGDRRTWRSWRLRAEATLDLLDRLAGVGTGAGTGPGLGPVVIVVSGTGHDERNRAAAALLRVLAPLQLRMAVSTDLRPRLADAVAGFLDAGADEVLLAGGQVSALAFRDGGGEREIRHLVGYEVVLRLVPAAHPVRVSVAGGTADTEAAVSRAVDQVLKAGGLEDHR